MKRCSEIPPVKPIVPIPNNGYNAYQTPYFDNRQQNHKEPQEQNNMDGDYFEKSDGGDPEYLYTSDGSFKETLSFSRLVKSNQNRLAEKSLTSPITDQAECDVRTVLVGPPLYILDDNSYMNYVNQNPNNKYIKQMNGEELNQSKNALTDYNRRYLEDDNFTLRNTSTAGLKRLVRKSDSSKNIPSKNDYLKERDKLIDKQQEQRSDKEKEMDKGKNFQEVLKDKLRMFFD